jgi:SAM-dependent methyltransferase
VDWGIGEYERTAADLEPAAVHVVAAAGLRDGERVLDVGCGSGNATLLAARAGAEATGLDPAERLLRVARRRAAEQGLAAGFVAGDALELPFADASFDVVVSVFAVIFVPDAGRAARELFRVLRPGGRVVLSSWLDGDALGCAIDVIAVALHPAGAAAGGFSWDDPRAVRELLARHGEAVGHELAAVAFSRPSPAALVDEMAEHHPLGILGSAELRRRGTWQATRSEALALLEDANEDPSAFRTSMRYQVAWARRPGST